MKNNKKYIVIGSILLGVILIITGFLIFRNPNRITSKEKKWINDNKNTLFDIRIPNDVNTFGKDGSGVFFDYLNSFKEKYELNINIITYSYGAVTPGVSFKISNGYSLDDTLFFEDHFVLVSKDKTVVNDINDLTNKKIGLLNTDYSYISYYLTGTNISYEQYNSLDLVIENAGNLDYMILPLNLMLDKILLNNLNIVYHLGDINQYYTLSFEKDDMLKTIMNKHYNQWNKDNYKNSYNEGLMNSFVHGLKLSEADIHTITSKEYKYGIVEHAPYEILSGSNYGGIVANYINGFIDITNIDIKYLKYKTYDNLNKVANNNNLDLYFSYVNLANKFTPIDSLININYSIISKNTNKMVVNSLNSLKGKVVYVQNNTALMTYINSLNIMTVKTYDNFNDVFDLIKKDNIVIIDTLFFDYYNNTKFNNTVSKYNGEIDNISLEFRSNGSDTFNNLFKSYISFIDSNSNNQLGIDSYNHVLKTGVKFSSVFWITLLGIGAVLVSGVVFLKNKTKFHFKRKINPNNKMKYYDYLTNLKNRNYLTDNIEEWNMNTIYPQTIIIVDLNKIKVLNDTYGHEEGDNQIKSLASILFKTQPDNSEIIRTDGNEFLIYLVGHNEKQVSTYIHKLNKEFKDLPYEYGASLGYSVRNDDLKLLEDTINEATIDMRKNKAMGVTNDRQN